MTVSIIPIDGIGEIEPGSDLAGMLAERLADIGVQDHDVVVVTQKVVSKSEGAMAIAATDAEYRQVVDRESAQVLRRRGDLVITVTKHGFVCANAGVDRSNVSEGQVVLLPTHPDRSASRLRQRLTRDLDVNLAVIITDTFGRAWRNGLVDVAIGVAGMKPILDLRGTPDTQGRVLEVTEVALADEIAAAADLVMGKARGIPAVIVRGVIYPRGGGKATDLIRQPGEDLFR